MKEEKFYEAEKILRSALEATEKKQQGTMNNAMANNYSNLAEILYKTGRQAESIELINKVLVRMSSMEQEIYTKKQQAEIRAQLNNYINHSNQNSMEKFK